MDHVFSDDFPDPKEGCRGSEVSDPGFFGSSCLQSLPRSRVSKELRTSEDPSQSLVRYLPVSTPTPCLCKSLRGDKIALILILRP